MNHTPNIKLQALLFLITLISATIVISTLVMTEAHAQGVALSTYPSTLRLQAQKSAVTRSVFSVENKTKESVKLDIILKQFKADAANDGKVLFIEGNEPEIFKRIQIFDKNVPITSLELAPRQNKQLEIVINTNSTEPTADYYFSIILVAKEPTLPDPIQNEATAYSVAQAGIATNVLLAVGNKDQPQGYLEEFSTPFYRDAGPVPFVVKIKNRGPHYFTPKGVILIKNIFGQTVGRMDIQNANILAGTSRSLSSTSMGMNASGDLKKSSDFSSQHIVWPEKFLLGFYTADLSIALSHEGPVFTQTIRFVAFPFKILIGGVIFIIIFLLMYIRIKHKMKEI